ncbi:hypothetical protein AG1IA_04914 [Rhizoctonia solani AG-1 IA]|uniref:Uncharacterized protein n=1 Tax=Thanatephorus cucumeris (strain AG1-IA) TaxID=983506 RepID=L8WW45_THACA|nr:hypothetical protein AG1IA_04914 [Rhizoctonia solani AG-1 IA]
MLTCFGGSIHTIRSEPNRPGNCIRPDYWIETSQFHTTFAPVDSETRAVSTERERIQVSKLETSHRVAILFLFHRTGKERMQGRWIYMQTGVICLCSTIIMKQRVIK